MCNKKIRNIGIVAHVDAGKTTITEHLLYNAGAIKSLGSVDTGTAQTDWLDVERERGISVKAAAASFDWNDIRINLIDTPGHIDFSAEVERSLRVLDGAILVISSVEGIQAQTEVLWQALNELSIPTIIFINKIDRIGSDISKVLAELRMTFAQNAIPMQAVYGEGGHDPVVKDILPGHITAINESLYSDTGAINERELLDNLMEAVSVNNEELLTDFLNGNDISVYKLLDILRNQVTECKLYPVSFGSAIDGIGIEELLRAITSLLPSPAGAYEGELSGVVFKLERDRNMGRVAHVRLYNGTIRNRDRVFNLTKNLEEKVSQIRRVHVQKFVDVGVLKAGDIAAVYGLNNTAIGDILGSSKFVPKEKHLAVPHLKVQVHTEDCDYIKMVEALQELADEDPLLSLEWLKNERELHIKIMGTIQLEVLTSILKNRFGLNVLFSKPSVIYKETPEKSGEGFEAYTMPKPCWAIVRLLIEPQKRGSGLTFISNARADRILPRYQNHIEKCLPDALKEGNYGWEVTDLKVTLLDGESHNMHTHPLDFFIATPMAVANGLVNTGTILLEPVLDFRLSAPDDFGGKIMNDLIMMRGEFDTPVLSKGNIIISGSVPASAFMDYPVKLNSITGGRGILTTRFYGYRPCSLDQGAISPRRGVSPLDRAKYILYARNAITE